MNNKGTLSDTEREKLKSRIIRSARILRENRKIKQRARLLYGAAASIVILFGVFSVFDMLGEQSLQDFVDEDAPFIDVSKSNQVTVVLGEGKKVQLKEKNNTLKYSPTGKDLQVGTGEKYRQILKDEDKPIFNTILVPYGKRTDVTLSDGTKVWINSGSRLVYPVVFKGDRREVYLEGEAIFEVSHNPKRPFLVLSSNQEVEVLGTVFNISSYREDEKTSTVLKSGSVLVTYAKDDGKSFKITPGTRSSYNSTTKEIDIQYAVNMDEYFGWRKGFFSFQKNDLKYIATKLSRYYGVEIIVKGEQLSKDTYSGKIDLKEDVYSVIQTLGKAYHFTMERQADKIILITTQQIYKTPSQ
ncbi:FecR domain-containing protein [Muricauda oceani]|nr:FecR domain-containing protein [Allomuricauda sp.]MBW8245195.1 FecR domain-containing protein [Allomuricauda oceani]